MLWTTAKRAIRNHRSLLIEGIVWSAEDKIGIYETNGVKIAMLAYQTFNGRYPDLFNKVPQVEEASRHDIVIVSFHWEMSWIMYQTQTSRNWASLRDAVRTWFRHHSHRINP